MICSQKKSVNLRKKNRAITTVFCLILLVFTAAGCGKVEEPVPVQLSSGNVVELQNGSAEEIEDDSEETVVRDTETDQEDNSVEATKVDTGDDMDENAEEDTQTQSVGSAELVGHVRSVGADCFVVAREEVWSEGGADYAVVATSGYEDEEDLITVYVSQNCVWEFKTVKNGGINPEDVSAREGSFADLQEDISTTSKGNWQDDGSFLADSIVMMLFV